MYEKRYVPTGNGCEYFQVFGNGHEGYNIGEIAQRLRELCGNATITREHLTRLEREVAA